MNGIGFQLASPARGSGGKIPRTVEKALAAAYAEAQGALLLVNGSDQFDVCGADPILVAAVALTPGGTDTTGYNILGHKEFPPGYMQGISVADGTQFNAPFQGTFPAAPGGQYGVTRNSSGVWVVDFDKNINIVVTYIGQVDYSPAVAAGSEPYVLVEFLPAVIQPI